MYHWERTTSKWRASELKMLEMKVVGTKPSDSCHRNKWNGMLDNLIFNNVAENSRSFHCLKPWGGTPLKKVGHACQKIGIKPLKETNLGVAQAFFPHKRCHLQWNRLPLFKKEADMKAFIKYYFFKWTFKILW